MYKYTYSCILHNITYHNIFWRMIWFSGGVWHIRITEEESETALSIDKEEDIWTQLRSF